MHPALKPEILEQELRELGVAKHESLAIFFISALVHEELDTWSEAASCATAVIAPTEKHSRQPSDERSYAVHVEQVKITDCIVPFRAVMQLPAIG
jgi:hypothetical protein